MAAFVIAVIKHPSIAVVVAMRSAWPFMHPSPKNWPGSKGKGVVVCSLHGGRLRFLHLNLVTLDYMLGFAVTVLRALGASLSARAS
jgi:hypothetical protein